MGNFSREISQFFSFWTQTQKRENLLTQLSPVEAIINIQFNAPYLIVQQQKVKAAHTT